MPGSSVNSQDRVVEAMPRGDPYETLVLRLSRRHREALREIGHEMAAADAAMKVGRPGEKTLRDGDQVNYSAVIRRLLGKADARFR